MKTVMQLLSLLLCFEFVVAPVQGLLLMNSAMADEEKSCPAGQKHEPAVNRCLTKTEVLKVNEATQACGTNKECYKENASTALSDANFKDEAKSGGIRIGAAAALAVPLVVVTTILVESSKSKGSVDEKTGKAGSSFSCNPPSLLLMYGAAAALAVGEVYGYYSHKAKLKKIKEQWDTTVVPKEDSGADLKRTEATEAQSQAFEFLAQNEEQVAKTAKTKRGFYLAAGGLFAAGAVSATVEYFQLQAAKKKIAAAAVSSAMSGGAATISAAELYEAKKTINRLSCFTNKAGQGNAGKSPEELAKETQNKADELAAKTEQKRLEAEKLKKAEDDYLLNGTDEARKQQIRSQRGQDAENILNEAEENKTFNEINESIKKHNENLQPIITPTTPNYPKINLKELEKLKRVAAYNLSTAKNAEQFVYLMKEFESIEFENYSTASYPEVDQSLKGISFTPEIAQMIAATLVPQAHAQGLMAVLPMAMPLLNGMKGIMNIVKFNNGKPMNAGEMQQIAESKKSWVMKQIGAPATRFAINGVLGGWMAIQQDHMKKQADLGTKRAAKLRSMKEDFASANGLMYCKEEDRQDPTKPKCFCYTPDNKVNPSRTSNEVCKNALATIKNNTGTPDTDKVCVTSAMAMDSTCACRATNTCLKTTAGFSSMGFSPNTFKMISANSGAANDLFNGNASAGDIADSAGINAARTQAAAANAIAGDKAAVKESKAAADAFEKGLLATTSGLSMGGLSNSSPLPSSPAAAAAALDKEIADSNKDIEVTNSGASNSPSSSFGNAVDEVPEFGMSSADSNNQEIEIAEVMGKEIDFGSNDINKTKDTNLFEVLSNRYQRSGMRRLFNEGKPAPADAPAKSDISN